MTLTRIERLRRFAIKMIGEPVDVARDEFYRLFTGQLIGGLYGMGGEFKYEPGDCSLRMRIMTEPPIDGGSGVVKVVT